MQALSKAWVKKIDKMFQIIVYYPYHPWDWYIYLHVVDSYGINVGKYTSPMDGMGLYGFVVPPRIHGTVEILTYIDPIKINH